MTIELRSLGEESWGNRFRRAREASCLTVRATAELLNRAGFDVSHATIARWEHSADTPTGPRRLIACAALILYGINPGEFGLDDVHHLLDVEALLAAANQTPMATSPHRRSSGRSPSAGSGSSPRKFGCSPDQFRKVA